MSKKGKRNSDRHKRIIAASARAADKSRREIPGSFNASCGIALSIQAGSDDPKMPKLATFSGIGYTGAPMKPEGWNVPIIVDLDGVESAQHIPILRQHDHQQIVGHANSVTASKDGIKVDGVFSGQKEHADKVTIPAKNGLRWQMSIGANPDQDHMEFLERGETATVNGREVTGPLNISRKTTVSEISFVPVGADPLTSASIAASSANRKGRPMNAKAMLRASGKFSDEEIDKMEDKDAKAALKKCMRAEDDSDVDAADDDSDADDKDKEKEKKAEARAMASFKAEIAKLKRGLLNEMTVEAAAEQTRQSAIFAAVDLFGLRGKMVPLTEKGQPVKASDGREVMVDLAAHAIKNQWDAERTAQAAELHTLRAGRPGAGVGVPGGLGYITSSPEMSGAVLECAVLDALRGSFKLFDDDFYQIGDDGKRRIAASEQKRIQTELNTAYPDKVRQAAHTMFRGQIGLKQLLSICAKGGGYRGPDNWHAGDWGTVADYLAESTRPQNIRADGPSTVNTPATLANVQNKFMLQGYLFTEQVFMEIAQILPVKDLKPTKSVQLFGDFQFQTLNPSGEIQHATMGDNPYANQAQIRARMITLTLQYIIDDDLGMFGQVPAMLGRGWGLDVNDLFWTAFMNPGLDGGGSTNFYAATHTIAGQLANSNLSSGATTTLTSEGLRLANILFANQIDPAGKPLGVDPELLIYPPELDNAALELMNAQFIIMAGLASTSAASKQPNTNIYKGRYKPLMSRYLNKSAYTGYSTAAWYLFANPGVIPVIQIAALNGQMTPMIQTAGQDWQFNQLGITMRGWGGVGANPQNFRGAVKSAGA